MKIKLSLLTVTILFFGIGCDLQQANHETYGKVAEAVNTQKLISQKAGAGIVYKVSYDQVTIELAPNDLASAKKAKEAGEKPVLQNYERVNQTVTINDQGYINITTEWLDGDADLNMPKELYQRKAHLMPARGQEYKPVAKSVLANGFMRYYAADGEVLREFAVDESQFKVERSQFLNALAQSRIKQDLNERASQVLSNFNQSNNVKRLNNRFAEISSNIPGTRGAATIQRKKVVDLALGVVVRSEDKGPDGRVLNREFMKYAQTDNLPVLRHRISEYYGETDGSWRVTSRKIVNRDNIKIHIN